LSHFGKLKDWRRVSIRYDRYPTVFLSAIALAAAVIFWLSVLILGHLNYACQPFEQRKSVSIGLWQSARFYPKTQRRLATPVAR
jgi:hypothetical protein